jgi:hypothetical protein
MVLRAGLLSSLIVGLLSAAAAPDRLDHPIAGASAQDACPQLRTPAQEHAHAFAADRCLATTPQTTDYRLVSDHGGAVGEPYDGQGNLIDRHGNIVAVPVDRAAAGEQPQQVREVFVSEPGAMR